MQIRGNSRDRRPRFLLSFTLKDLINVPQEQGRCFIKWSLKDGTGTSAHAFSSDSKGNLLDIHGINQNSGTTPIADIRNHHAVWNYQLEVPLHIKLHVNNSGVLVNKILKLEIYVDKSQTSKGTSLKHATTTNSSLTPRRKSSNLPNVELNEISTNLKKHASQAHTTVLNGINGSHAALSKSTLLGTVQFDIVDYIREDESSISNRYLLQNAKVNTILQVSLCLKLIRGKYSDFTISRIPNRSSKSSIQSGIGNMFQQGDSVVNSYLSGSTKVNESNESENLNGTSFSGSKMHSSISTVKPSPLVEDLYMKSLILSWDERPGEFSVQECVDDILKGGDGWARNENGVKLIDLKTYGDKEEMI